MKNSSFEKAYLKIIAQQKKFIKNNIITEAWGLDSLTSIGKGLISPLGGLVEGGQSLVKGDLVGVGKGLLKIATSPVEVTTGVLKAPLEVVGSTADKISEIRKNEEETQKLLQLAKDVKEEQIKQFEQHFPDVCKKLKEDAKKESDKEDQQKKIYAENIKLLIVGVYAEKLAKKQAQKKKEKEDQEAAEKKKKEDNDKNLKQKIGQIQNLTKDLPNGQYTVQIE